MDEALRYYFDEHVLGAVARGLRKRGIDVLTAEEAGRAHKGIDDDDQPAYATEQGRVMVTGDRDYVLLARTQFPHAGVILLQKELSIGGFIEYLELFALTTTPEWMRNRLVFCDWEE
jgi:predicted nuclease of predicted toxin-antitoxin system